MAKKRKVKKPKEVYAFRPVKSKAGIRILALDPGMTNMAISVVGVDNKYNLEVLANAIMVNPLSNLKANFKTDLELFLSEVDKWVVKFKPQAIGLERFMSRGNGGITIECVNIMIGAIAARYKLPIKGFPAAQWKNAWHRKFTEYELDDLYKYSKTTPHQLDSILIGAYCLEYRTQHEVVYTPDSVINMAEKSSLTKLINRKVRKC